MVVYSFLFFLVIFVLIGVSSTLKSKKSNSDYLLAGHDIPPWLAALSAIATNNSGYMFIGMIGYTYTSGLQSIWLMVGWIFGDFIISFFVHKKLRQVTEKKNLLSFGGVLSRWQNGTDFRKLRLLVGLITVIFLGVYAAAQFKAGSKALHVLFGWDYSTGAIIGSIIVFLYCLSGGIRASIWTDAAQSIVMIFAMSMLFFVGVSEVGGFDQYITKLDAVSPGFLSLTPTGLILDNSIGVFLFILGWIFGGFGVVGQPHIMIRFMTVNDAENINKIRKELQNRMKECLWLPENTENYQIQKQKINRETTDLEFDQLKASLNTSFNKLPNRKKKSPLIHFLAIALSLPNLIPLWITRKVIGKFKDIVFTSSMKYSLGLFLFPIWWLGTAIPIAYGYGNSTMTTYLLVSILSLFIRQRILLS